MYEYEHANPDGGAQAQTHARTRGGKKEPAEMSRTLA